MKFFKKAAAMLLAGVMAVTALCAVASAESVFSTKNTFTSGKKVTINVKETGSYYKDEEISYKFKASKSGKFILNYTIDCVEMVNVYLCDADGAHIKADSREAKSGTSYIYNNYEYMDSNRTSQVGSGSFTYSIKKGTYYVKIVYDTHSGGKVKLTPKFPSEDSDDSASDAKLDSLTISVKKGTTLSFGTLVTGAADLSDIKWSTSDKSVATVSGGKVKALKKGSAVITAKLGSSVLKITVKVTA